jgi:hypothetical protein
MIEQRHARSVAAQSAGCGVIPVATGSAPRGLAVVLRGTRRIRASSASHRDGRRRDLLAVIAGLPRGWCRDGVVDEDAGDGGGCGEAIAVEYASAGRGAVDEQRQLFSELLGVGGAG